MIHINDPEMGLLGYVAIDSFIGNKAYGGIRVRISDNARDEAHPAEAAHLAREMSLKFGFHQIPRGGAKFVIVLPPNLGQEQRDDYFKAFGKQLGPLLRKDLIQTGLDMGMTGRDLHLFGQGTGLIPSHYPPPSGFEKSDSGRFTAIGIMETFRAARRFYGPGQQTWTCALEGFGSVGWHLAGYLADEEVKVVAVSTLAGGLYDPAGLDVQRLMTLQKEHGDSCVNRYNDAQRIEPARLFEKEVDVLFPCGGFFSINQSNVHNLQCRLIISGANGAMDDSCAGIVQRRGIHYIPGFVANAGSVLRSYVAKQGKITQTDILEQRIREVFAERLERLLEESKKNNLSVYEQAVNIARNNIREMSLQKDDSGSSLRRKIVSLWKK